MMNKVKATLLAVSISAGLASGAHASLYSITVQEANTAGASFNAIPGALNQAITATFMYSGNLDFSNTQGQNSNSTGDLNSDFFGASASGIFDYSGSGALPAPSNANFNSLGSFLASSGSAGGYLYGSLYTITLGNLAVGTTLTITHDDGVSLSSPSGAYSGTLTSGPTTAITEEVTITTAGAYTLYYARENGSPSVLDVAVPEPMSLALVGTGLTTLGLLRRKRKA